MANLTDWNAYMNLLHEHALVEDDLRGILVSQVEDDVDYGAVILARRVLFERFGVG